MSQSNLAGSGIEPAGPPQEILEETPAQRRERGLANFKRRCDRGDENGCKHYRRLLKIVEKDRAEAARKAESLKEIRGNVHDTSGNKVDRDSLKDQIAIMEIKCETERSMGFHNSSSCRRLEDLKRQLSGKKTANSPPPEVSNIESQVFLAGDELSSTSGKQEQKQQTIEQRLESEPRPPRAPTVKKSIDKTGLSQEEAQLDPASSGTPSPGTMGKNLGIGGDHLVEPVPSFVQAKTEKVISNRYNSWIVLGRDRGDAKESNRASGYGGKGHTQCASIDIVAGRMSPHPRSVGFKDEPLYCDPIFNTKATPYGKVTDAARIYISQKTDIDDNFMLADGKIGKARARSAIGLKADGIRIMSREGIKLVTRADKMNSQGGNVNAIRGVDIIAGNNDQDDDPIQPMVLGDNVVEAFNEMAEIVSELVGTTQSIINNVAALNTALSTHFHPSPFFGAPTLPSPTAQVACLASLVKLASVDTFSAAAAKFNLVKFKGDYLKPGSPKKIRSKYNNVN